MADMLNGEFVLGQRLGRGSEGEVYVAISSKTNQKVAVKFLRGAHDHPGHLESLKRLKGSAVTSCALLLDVFEHQGRVVTVHEFIEGAPLLDSVRHGEWTSSKLRVLADALIHAIRNVHKAGLSHGDLSPENVFLLPDGNIKLIDPRLSSSQPGSGVLGTPNYTAPEMLYSESVPNPAADVFSLSGLLYALFEGKTPFGCQSAEEYVLKAGTKSLTVGPFGGSPEDFRRLIVSGLALDPGARPQSVEQLLEHLDGNGRRKRLTALGMGTVAAFLLASGWYVHSRGPGMDSIAVLPFASDNHNADTEYLSEGLTENIIDELAQLPGIRVSPRDSVFRFKGPNRDLAQIARELGVRAIVTGRLVRREGSLLVSVELLDAKENRQVWGERYDRKASAVLTVQKEISRKIFESLRVKITGATQRRLTTRGTDSPDAYQAYLKGRYYWNRRTAGNIGKALREFQQAVDADPAYAQAYIGLADCYAVLPQYAGVSMNDAIPKARAAALRALAIDDSLSEAHASLGYISMMSWQFKEADKEFRRSIELDSNYSTAHMWYGTFLHVMGNSVEAIAESRRAQQLDPLSPINGTLGCNIHLVTGEIETGIDECRKVLEIDETFPRAHDLLGWAYLKQGHTSDALAELAKAVEASGRASQELGYLGYGFGSLGRRVEAAKVLKELESRYEKQQSPGMFIAAVYAGLGDKDKAFVWLEKDFKARNGVLIYATYFPVYDTLRADPRYADLLRRIGIR